MKKILILIFALIFLFPTVKAEVITECRDINSPGEYVLVSNLILTDPMRTSCLMLNTGDVTINLNGKTISGKGVDTMNFGIYMGYFLLPVSNITIKNGYIVNSYYGIFFGGNQRNVVISNIETRNRIGAWFEGVVNLNISNSKFYDFSPRTFPQHPPEYYGLVVKGVSGRSYLRSNEFGKQEIVGGVLTQYAPDIGFLCKNSVGMNISNSKYIGLNYGGKFENCDGNMLWCNIFYQYKGYANGCLFDADSTTNWGCNQNGYINDLDYNTFVPTCPTPVPDGIDCPFQICVEGHVCKNVTHSAYQYSNCTIVNETYCQYGCDMLTGKCKASPTQYCGNGICEGGETPYNCPSDCQYYVTTTIPPGFPTYPNVSNPIPQLVNETEWREAGLGWALIFFSPIGLMTITCLIISAVVSRIAGTEFGILSFIFFLFILVIFSGMLPVWLLIVFILIAGGIIAWWMKGIVK